MKYLFIAVILVAVGCKKTDKKYCFSCVRKTFQYSNIAYFFKDSATTLQTLCDITQGQANDFVRINNNGSPHGYTDTVIMHDTVVGKYNYVTCTRQ